MLNATREQIKNAQGFDQDRWPAMADERWTTALHDYYRASYYWR